MYIQEQHCAGSTILLLYVYEWMYVHMYIYIHINLYAYTRTALRWLHHFLPILYTITYMSKYTYIHKYNDLTASSLRLRLSPMDCCLSDTMDVNSLPISSLRVFSSMSLRCKFSHLCIYSRIWTHVYINDTFIHVYIHIYIYMHIYVYIYMRIYTYMKTYICIHIYIYVCVKNNYIYVYDYMYISTCIYVHICTYIYV